MSLLDSLTLDSQEARKNHEKERLSVLQLALSAITNERIQKQKELTDEDVIVVLGRQVKQLKDALNDFKTGGRADLVESTQKEIEILSVYLPQQLSEEEIREKVKKIIADISPSGPQDFGKVMGAAMKELKGIADGNTVSRIIKESFS